MPGNERAIHDHEMWDVLVVGAGPAGSTAARVAAENGASVLLIDRAQFPRYKTCGGGLTGVSLGYLPRAALATLEQQTRAVRFSRNGRSIVTRTAPTRFLGMIQRERFDQALVDAAVAAGVTFADDVQLKSIDDAEHVTLETTAGTLTARMVIGADGTNGRTGKYVGVDTGGVDLALEHEIATPTGDTHWNDEVYLDWGPDAGTYAWMFPKAGLLTIGVIQAKGSPDETRAYLDRWTAQLGLADGVIERSSGHLAQWRTDASPLRRGNVVVTGDAAGLLDPFTREGISFALRSGTWAGQAAALGDLDGYVERVRRDLGPEISAGERLLRFFEKHPAIVHFLISTPVGSRLFMRVCRGETTLGHVFGHRIVRIALRLFGG
ncbi:geranylgeranyl reductase family protein [soil metagenome]